MWEYISQSRCWPFVKDFRHLKGQAEFPLSWVGWKKKKKKKRKQTSDQEPWWETEGEKRFLHLENPLAVGKSVGTEENF